MKWVAIAGSWRNTNAEVEADVRREVSKIFQAGNGIVTGGALGVDFYATDEALKLDGTRKQIRIFLPTTLERYAKHYQKRAEEGVITLEQAEALINQLQTVKNLVPDCIVENIFNEILDQKAYFERITEIINVADELIAFQVNNSEGTQDTINKAENKGIPVLKYSYTV